MSAAVAKRIIVGYDGSDSARRALDRAAELAGYGTTVTVVSVAPPAYSAGLPAGADAADVQRARELLAEARDALALRQVSVTTLDPIGSAAEQIVLAADELGADLVVVGSRNGHAEERAVLGSTSTKVLHHAPCDVLVVR